MSKVFTVADVKDAEADSIVHQFQGTVTKVFERRSGEKKNGDEWTLQTIVVEDDDGDEIDVKLWDHDTEIPTAWKGKTVTILAHKGTKGWSGVYATDEEYKGKEKRVLKMTGTGVITKGGKVEEQETEDEGDDKGEEREERKGKLRHEDVEPAEAESESDEDAVAQRLTQYSRLMGLCLDETTMIGKAHEKRNKLALTPEQFQAITSTLFIAMSRDLMQDKMPAGE